MSDKRIDERVIIGKILKPRGVRGEVKVLPLTDIPNRFEHLESILACNKQGGEQRLYIESVKYHGKFVYLRFAGRSSPQDVKNILGNTLQVEEAEVPALPEDVYYHFEIIGASVLTVSGQSLGTVLEIWETGSHDVYVVEGEEREYLIPATKEIVRRIDRETRQIVIHPLEGLLDI